MGQSHRASCTQKDHHTFMQTIIQLHRTWDCRQRWTLESTERGSLTGHCTAHNTGIRLDCTQSRHTAVLLFVCWLVGCFTSQQQASVSQGRICSDNFTRCHTEIEVADPTFFLTQSHYTDTGPTSPRAEPIMPGAWQGSNWSANF